MHSLWARRFDSSPALERTSALILPIVTRSARTTGGTAMLPQGAPRLTLSAASAPSTTPAQCIAAPTPHALQVATLRLLLAVALPYRPAASTAEQTTLPLIGIVKAACHRPLSGVQPLPPRSFPRRPLATKWTQPPTTKASRPPPFTHPLPPVGVQDGYSKGQKDNDTSGLCKARTRLWTAPPVEPQSPSPMSKTASGLAR